VCKDRSESCSGTDKSPPLTKHVDASDDDVDKACVSDSMSILVSSNSTEVQLAVDGVDIRPIGDAEWGNFQQSEALIPDVREVSPEEGDVREVSPEEGDVREVSAETEGSSLDIPVVIPPPVSDHMQGGAPHP
jgi:hypothetical protein